MNTQMIHFNLDGLKEFAKKNRPEGYMEDLCSNGNIVGESLYLTLETYDRLKLKYQGRVRHDVVIPNDSASSLGFEEVVKRVQELSGDSENVRTLKVQCEGVLGWIAENRFSPCWLNKQRNSLVTMYQTALKKKLIPEPIKENSNV